MPTARHERQACKEMGKPSTISDAFSQASILAEAAAKGLGPSLGIATRACRTRRVRSRIRRQRSNLQRIGPLLRRPNHQRHSPTNLKWLLPISHLGVPREFNTLRNPNAEGYIHQLVLHRGIAEHGKLVWHIPRALSVAFDHVTKCVSGAEGVTASVRCAELFGATDAFLILL